MFFIELGDRDGNSIAFVEIPELQEHLPTLDEVGKQEGLVDIMSYLDKEFADEFGPPGHKYQEWYEPKEVLAELERYLASLKEDDSCVVFLRKLEGELKNALASNSLWRLGVDF